MTEKRFVKILDGKGGQLLFVPCPELKVSVVSVWFPAGSVYDPVGKEGLAHFFEHLMLQKTKNEPDPSMRQQHLESEGIDFYAYTQKEVAYFYQIQEPGMTEKSLSLLLEGISDFVFESEDLDKEKSVVGSEKAAYDENPQEKIWDDVFKGLFQSSPFAHNPFGDTKSLSSIETEDIIRFYHERYRLSAATWVILSPLGDGTAEKALLEKQIVASSQPEVGKEVLSFSMGEIISVSETVADDQQAASLFSAAFRTGGIADTEQIIRIDLLRSILASGWISWLNKELRTKKGLIYWARSAFSQFSDRGYVAFFLDTDQPWSPELLEVLSESVKKLKDPSWVEQDLQDHKAAFATRFLKVYHNPEDLLWWYGYPAAHGIISLEPEEYRDRIKTVTATELASTAQAVFCDENRTIARR